MTELLSAGRSYTLVQDVVYALPASACRVAAEAAVEVSMDNDTWVALTGANTGTGVETSAQFIRATTADTIVSVKKF